MRLSLAESGNASLEKLSSVGWMLEGIYLEDAQCVYYKFLTVVNLFLFRDALRADIRCLPSQRTATQKATIAEKQQRLLARVVRFNQDAKLFTIGLEAENGLLKPDDPQFCSEEIGDDTEENQWRFWQGVADEEDYVDVEEDFIEDDPEDLLLFMPSSIGAEKLKQDGLGHLIEEEISLRQGQANDSLQKLRTHLGHKALLYRINFRSSSSVRSDTRSKQEIRRTVLKINQDARRYNRARDALIRLQASEDILGKYMVISQKDLRVSADVTEENRFGQSLDALPWFWRIGDLNTTVSGWDDECESFKSLIWM